MTILGLDPGREKMGAALVQMPEENVLARSILAPDAGQELARLVRGMPLDAVAVGNSTGHKELLRRLQEWLPLLANSHAPLPPVVVVDERNSTLEARNLYWRFHGPRGWRKFVPLGLQTPPVPVDDYAAAIVASRALAVTDYPSWAEWKAALDGT